MIQPWKQPLGLWSVLLVPLLALSGCVSGIPAGKFEGVIRRVVKRHDASIAANGSMSKTEKSQALLDSEILLLGLNEALAGENK